MLIGAGVRAPFSGTLLRHAFDLAGLNETELMQSIDEIEHAGRSTVMVGIERTKHDLLGGLLDVRG